jgi:hypothetical protein
MSSTSSAASAASPSDLNEPECEPSRSARSIPSAGASSPSTGQMSPAMTTCEPSPPTASGRWNFRRCICGGFPCQDISQRRKRWASRRTKRPMVENTPNYWRASTRFVIVENVAALLGRGLDVVLGDLAALGYDAEWHCIPASAVGAPAQTGSALDCGLPRRRPANPGNHWSSNHERTLSTAAPGREAMSGSIVFDFAAIAAASRVAAEPEVTCEACEGGGWECYGSGAGGPHFRPCPKCFNPEGHPSP